MTKNIDKQKLPNIVEDYMMSYSAYTLLHRAIPDIRDGLKPSLMRIIYSMYANKMHKFTKSLDVVGTVSKIHAHGSVYPTVVGMCQTDKHQIPYLDYNGNMGQHTSRDLQPASDRYTDVRLSQFTLDLLGDGLKTNQVDWGYNYDGTIKVPEVLPVRFPTILTHAQSGIGVGFASNIASFNIGEIADSIIHKIDKGEYKELTPDFATGGYILKNDDAIHSINHEGNGTIKIRGKATIEGREISITELPYTTTREAIIDKIVELAKDELSEVTNVIDLTGNDKMEILVTARKGTDMRLLLEKLYALTPLESSHSSNNMVIVDGLPKQLGVFTILDRWLEWRQDCVKRGLTHQIQKLEETLFELNVLEVLYKNKHNEQNEIIEIVRKEPNKTAIIQAIYDISDFTYKECECVYELRLNQFNQAYLEKRLEEKAQIEKKIDDLQALKDNPMKIIRDDMLFFKKKYGKERKSEVISVEIQEIKKVIAQELTDNNDYWVTITDMGYIFKSENKNSKKKMLPTDTISKQWKLNNANDEIFVYTTSRQGYKLQLDNLELNKQHYLPVELEVDWGDVEFVGCVSDYYPVIIQILTEGRVVKFANTSYQAGVNVFSNTHTDKFDLTHVLFLDKESKLELVDIDNNKYTIDTEDIRFTKNRTGSGQYIHSSRRNDIKSVKRK